MVCLEYNSLSPVPSSDTAHDASTVYMSSDPGRPRIDIGGECSTIDGSTWWLANDRGDTDGCGIMFAWSGKGDRNVPSYGVWNPDCGSGVCSGA